MYCLTFRRRLCGVHTFDGLDARKEHVENAPNHKALSRIFNTAQQFAVILFSGEIGRDGLEKVGVIAQEIGKAFFVPVSGHEVRESPLCHAPSNLCELGSALENLTAFEERPPLPQIRQGMFRPPL